MDQSLNSSQERDVRHVCIFCQSDIPELNRVMRCCNAPICDTCLQADQASRWTWTKGCPACRFLGHPVIEVDPNFTVTLSVQEPGQGNHTLCKTFDLSDRSERHFMREVSNVLTNELSAATAVAFQRDAIHILFRMVFLKCLDLMKVYRNNELLKILNIMFVGVNLRGEKTEYTHVRGGFLGTVVEFKETGKKIVFSVDEMCMEQALGEHWSKRVKTWPTFDDFMHEFKDNLTVGLIEAICESGGQ